jgi:hypothetical protein
VSDHLTSRDLHHALQQHARLTRSASSSYADVAREIGFVVIAVAVGWVLIGAPGVPAVARWITQEAKPRGMLAAVVGVAAFIGYQAAYSYRIRSERSCGFHLRRSSGLWARPSCCAVWHRSAPLLLCRGRTSCTCSTLTESDSPFAATVGVRPHLKRSCGRRLTYRIPTSR